MNSMGTHLARLICLGVLLTASLGARAQIAIVGAQAVDVTPSSFSVVWHADAVSTPSIELFADPAGTVDITDQYEVELYPLLGGDVTKTTAYDKRVGRETFRAHLQSLGMAKVRIVGLSPETIYYYRVKSDSESDQGVWPAGLPTAVTTPAENGFIDGSHQLVVTVNHPDSNGWSVSASTDESSYGISAFVGDGGAADQAVLNMANIFGSDGRNWKPDGQKTLSLSLRNGLGEPVEGTVDVTFLPDFAIHRVYVIEFGATDGPSITLIEPAAKKYTTGQNVILTWTDQTTLPAAGVALYYDTDNSGADGTLIASGLDALPDGTDDTYPWNTTGVADGRYYLYAQITDNVGSFTSYAPGAVTIDRNRVDGDGDGVSDLWETHYLGDTLSDGSGDKDNDGVMDSMEFDDDTDPEVPDVRLSLVAGQNLISLPIIPSPGMNSADLGQLIGAEVVAISRVNPTTGVIETTNFSAGVASGDVFSVEAGKGYFINLASAKDVVIAGLSAVGQSVGLAAGRSIIGFARVPGGSRAGDVLTALTGLGNTSTIRRFNRETGRYEFFGNSGSSVLGDDFLLRRGEGYIVSTDNAVAEFSWP